MPVGYPVLNIRSSLTKIVLGHFMLNPEAEAYVNELSRRFDLDSGNLARQLVRMEKEGILKSRWSGVQRYYSLNKDFPLLKEYKKIVLKTFGLEYTLKETLAKVPGISRAFIFGSYAANAMDASSDIDLLVMGEHSTAELNRVIAEFQKGIERPVHVVGMTTDEYEQKRKKDPFVRAIDNGPKTEIL